MNYLMGLNQLSPMSLLILFLWSLFWKGRALWEAARSEQKNWFIAMLILNTLGILEIIFLFGFAKNKMKLKNLKFWK